MGVDLFVSYARADVQRVETLVRALEGRGWSVFWDPEIPVGRGWRDHLDQQITGARGVVVAWTEASVRSDWVKEEAEAARRRGVLLPVLLDRVQPPFGFQHLQTADLADGQFRHGDRLESFLEQVGQFLRASASASASEELDESARLVWQVAADEALHAGESTLEPDHLLLGCLSLGKVLEATPAPLRPDQMERARLQWQGLEKALSEAGGPDLASLRRTLRKPVRNAGTTPNNRRVRRSDSTRRCFSDAARFAHERGVPQTSARDLLLGLLGIPALASELGRSGVEVQRLELALRPELPEAVEVLGATPAVSSPLAGVSPIANARAALELLYELPRLCAGKQDVRTLLAEVARRIAAAFPETPHVGILLRGDAAQGLELAAHEPPGEPLVSLTLAWRAMERREAFGWRQGTGDLVRSMLNQRTAAAMYAPLIWNGEALGVVAVGGRTRSREFNADELRLLIAVAHQLALALAQRRTLEQLEVRRRLLERLGGRIPPAILDALSQHPEAISAGAVLEAREATVLAVHLGPGDSPSAESAGTVGRAVAVAIEAMLAARGVIVRVGRDAVTSVHGMLVEDAEQATHALEAGCAIRAALLRTGYPVRLAIHRGILVQGLVTSGLHVEPVADGPALDEARRICGAAAAGELLLSNYAHRRLWGAVAVHPREMEGGTVLVVDFDP